MTVSEGESQGGRAPERANRLKSHIGTDVMIRKVMLRAGRRTISRGQLGKEEKHQKENLVTLRGSGEKEKLKFVRNRPGEIRVDLALARPGKKL